MDSQREAAVWHRELSSGVCDDLEGWGGGIREVGPREGTRVCIYLVHLVVQQKLTQRFKATMHVC